MLLMELSETRLTPVDFDDVDQFSVDAVQKYEDALIAAEKRGIKIRALMLCNPHVSIQLSYHSKPTTCQLKQS